MLVAGIIGGAAVGGDSGVAEHALRVNEILSSLMLRLCRAATAELSRHRAVEGPERPQLPADARRSPPTQRLPPILLRHAVPAGPVRRVRAGASCSGS